MEGKLVARAIASLAKRDSLDEKGVRSLLEGIGFFEETFDGLGFCLSEEGDLLSQWRGYAEDGTGVAIGFSVEYLKWLSSANGSRDNPGITLDKVEYEPSAHEARVEPTYRKVTQLIKDGTLKGSYLAPFQMGLANTSQKVNVPLYHELSPLFPQLFSLKASAFREEHEWRILSYLTTDGEEACSHRVVGNRIVPYRKVDLIELERGPIAEVILGPRHGTPPEIVQNFLQLNGYGLVKVRPSEASYR
jgi:hypothetical protein